MRYLVTGGAGFIGSHIVETLLKKGIPKGLSPTTEGSPVGKGTVPEKAAHEVFNVANGKDNTVLQLVEYLNKIIGKDIKPAFLAPRAGDVFRTCADISKLRKILKFESKVDFQEGLKHTVEWFKSKQGLSPAKSNSEDIKSSLV